MMNVATFVKITSKHKKCPSCKEIVSIEYTDGILTLECKKCSHVKKFDNKGHEIAQISKSKVVITFEVEGATPEKAMSNANAIGKRIMLDLKAKKNIYAKVAVSKEGYYR